MSVENVVALFFENSKVEFSQRQTNEVVHTLAREVTLLISPHIFNDVQPCIWTLISNENL